MRSVRRLGNADFRGAVLPRCSAGHRKRAELETPGMGEIREVAVPDIGDFKDVPIIEVAVQVGDRVKAEAPLITLESDKASMEVPSPSAGMVKALAVKVGDRVSQGMPILSLELDGEIGRA